MSISISYSIETKNGEAAVLSFSAERMQQENETITLLDANGDEAVTIRFAPGSKHRVL